MIAIACLWTTQVHAQAAQPAESATDAPVAEDAAASVAEPPAAEVAPAPATPPPPATRQEGPPPVVRPFPVPDNTPPPVPDDWDAPRFPRPGSRSKHNFETGIHFGIPIFLTAADAVDPGFAIAGRWGFVAGMVVPEMHVGWQINSIADDPLTGDAAAIDALNLGFGMRLRLASASTLTPFISGAIDLNFWRITGDNVSCDPHRGCEENREFSPGFSSIAGVAIELSPRVVLELGVRLGMTFEGGIMEQTELWITPLVGMGFYHR